MTPSICIGSYTKEQIKDIRNAGFKNAELSFAGVATMPEQDRKEYLGYLKELGFSVFGANCFFGQGLGGFFTEYFDLGKIREYIASAFENTKELKWSTLAFGSGYMRNIPDGYGYEKAFSFMASFIKEEIVPYLEKYDAYLNIEELRKEETNFITSCAEGGKLAEAVGSARVGLLCDYYHMSMAGETADDVPAFGKYIKHVHIASPSNNRVIPLRNDGDGERYEAFFKALDKTGYNGYVSVESFVPKDGRFADKVKNCYEYLSEMLESI